MITLNGLPLLIPDESGEIQKWIDYYQPLPDLRAISPMTPARVSSRGDSRSGNPNARGLPRANFPLPPPLKINSLYWPTGATRWAQGLFLADKGTKDRLVTAMHSGTTTAMTLKIGTPETYTIEPKMHLLTPRPISPPSYDGGVWLLPLVDERFFWQDRYTTDFSYDTEWGSAWSTMFSVLGTALGVTITADSNHTDYISPDIQELSRNYENAAVLLDAVSHSVGQRIVRDYDGTITSMNWDTSTTRLADNQDPTARDASAPDNAGALACGGMIGAIPGPTSMSVAFPKFADFRPYVSGITHVETNTTGVELANGATAVMHSTLFADFSTRGGSPDNATALADLATQATVDFAKFYSQSYDITFSGVYKWDQTGWCDHTLIDLGYQRPDGSLAAQTRVQSLPYNFRIEEQLSQTQSLEVYGDFQWGKADGAISARSGSTMQSGTVSLYYINSSDVLTDTSVNVTAWNGFGQAVTSGAFVQIAWIQDLQNDNGNEEGRWVIVSEDCP